MASGLVSHRIMGPLNTRRVFSAVSKYSTLSCTLPVLTHLNPYQRPPALNSHLYITVSGLIFTIHVYIYSVFSSHML